MQIVFQLLESVYELEHLRDHPVIGRALPAVMQPGGLCLGTID